MSSTLEIHAAEKILGDIEVPGDKSISHRAVILSSIADQVTHIENLLLGDDVLSTIHIMRALGVDITVDEKKKSARVQGVGLHGLKAPQNPLNCGNSGTTMRLLCGLLSAQKFNSVLIGDDSLSKRPMLRVAEPLRLMGAKINLSNNTAPIEIFGNQTIVSIDYRLTIPSAQVKSAILLAGLYAQGETIVRENRLTRDHTERMLRNPPGSLGNIKIPGDMSSAAFFIVLATLSKNSSMMIRDVGVNPFRTGIIDILQLMGARIELSNHRFFGYEPVADIRVTYSPLKGIVIPLEFVSTAIDEFPIIFIAAAVAEGVTVLRGAHELRVKESDRLATMCAGLKKLGVTVHEYDDGVLIQGNSSLQGGEIQSSGDHRVAMAFAIAGAVANDVIFVDNSDLINTSFPHFVELAIQVGMKIRCL